MAAIEVAKFDLLYGKLLKIIGNVDRAKQLTFILYNISADIGIDHEQLLKYVTVNGLKFDNEIYAQLNKARTNSSQIGFIDQTTISPNILQQVV
jgi:hypothetical protein